MRPDTYHGTRIVQPDQDWFPNDCSSNTPLALRAFTMRHPSLQDDPLVILGAGYTGQRLYHQARAAGWNAVATSRTPATHLSDIRPAHRILFDLGRPETWKSIPFPAHIIWCFPATPLHLVQDFFAARPRSAGRLIVLGSTSAYGKSRGVVTEQSPLNMNLPRVQSEEYLRTHIGAVIIRLAGLYGPDRHVLDWIRKGKVHNTPKWVNLLHVDDAAGMCLQALEQAQDGAIYLASDGTPRTWSEIFSMASSTWNIPIPPSTPTQETGKQVSAHKILTDLTYRLRVPDLYQALDHIEKNLSR